MNAPNCYKRSYILFKIEVSMEPGVLSIEYLTFYATHTLIGGLKLVTREESRTTPTKRQVADPIQRT